jgi:MoxR-like ATPase
MTNVALVNTAPRDETAAVDINTVLNQLESVLIGKRQQVTLALACILAKGHLLVEDVPGVGKTTLAHALGATLGLEWKRVQFTNDLMPADVVGVSVFNTATRNFEFKPGPVFTSILLADEINRAPPKAQSALLEAMEEGQVTVDGNSYPLNENFFVIATQNPTDQLGAYPLPESQLDRFLVSMQIGYPDHEAERQLLQRGDTRSSIASLPVLLPPSLLDQWREQCQQVHVSDTVLDYILELLTATRSSGQGLSPRAGLSLMRLCRASAFIRARQHVLPDDVRDMFPALAAHRLTGQLSSGLTRAREVLSQVPMP